MINVSTNYAVSANTVYGWNGRNIISGTVHQSSLLSTKDVYDVVNGTVAIPAAQCLASVWFPDKTLFVTNQTMALSDSNGNAYIDFTVPDIDGVYEYQAVCQIGNRTLIASHSFHVTRPRIMAVISK